MPNFKICCEYFRNDELTSHNRQHLSLSIKDTTTNGVVELPIISVKENGYFHRDKLAHEEFFTRIHNHVKNAGYWGGILTLDYCYEPYVAEAHHAEN